MGSHIITMIVRSVIVIITFISANLCSIQDSDNSKEAMKEIKPPNLMLEKMRSLHKRKADFRPHRPSPSFNQHNSFTSPSHPPPPPPPPPVSSSSSYGAPPPAPASSGYGSPAAEPVADYGAPHDEEIDLHNKEFCVDVSTYQPVIWVERDGQVCKTDWVKQCEDRTENVCIDVTETICEVVPYKECKQGLEPQEFSETILTPKKFVEMSAPRTRRRFPTRSCCPSAEMLQNRTVSQIGRQTVTEIRFGLELRHVNQ